MSPLAGVSGAPSGVPRSRLSASAPLVLLTPVAHVTLVALVALLVSAQPGCGGGRVAPDAALDGGAICGNGQREPGEECDDGNDDNSDGCCNSCHVCAQCTASHWAPCEQGKTVCCPTGDDLPTECAPHSSDPEGDRCLIPCDESTDCHWSNECGAEFPGHCWPAFCGGGSASPVNGPCQVGDAPGYCYPLGSAQDGFGLCVESGILPEGASCEGGHYLDEIPRTVQTCTGGVCASWVENAPPRCLPFCDPVSSYDSSELGAAACPAGYNCLSMSYISVYSRLRTADKGWCVPTPSTDASGLLSCDLLGGGLIADRSLGCDDLLPDTGCGYFRSGSLMGICQPMDASPVGLGDVCDTDSDLLPCAQGLLCTSPDPFGTGDATGTRCLEICDAADPSWVCDATDLSCTSLSEAYFTAEVTSDGSPTRLGLCAPPPQL